MKKILSLLLVAIMAVGLCACGSDSNTSAAKTDDTGATEAAKEQIGEAETKAAEDVVSEVHYTDDGRTLLRVAIAEDIANEGVWLSNDGKGRKYIIYSVYEPLFNMDGMGGDLVPCIGKSYERVDDTTYKIEIFDDVYDTDGNHITSSDVLWSFETAAEPKSRNLKWIESFTAEDDTHLTLKLKSNDVGLFERAMFQTHIVSQKAYEESGDEMKTQAVATGPYKITEWEEGTKIVLEKNENYWQDEEQYVNFQWQNVDVVEFYIIPESVQQLTGLDTDKVDVVLGLTYDKASDYMEGGSKSEGYTVFDSWENTMYIDFNCNEASQCSDINLRKAIAYAIDRQGLLDGVADGCGEVATGFNSQLADYVEAWDDYDYYAYDPELAKEYLAKSDYDGEKLVLLTDTKEIDTDTSQMILNYLEAVGIHAELLSVESSIQKETAQDFTAWDMQVSNSGTADYMTVNWRTNWDYTTQANGLQPTGIVDEKLHELLSVVRNVETFSDESVDAFMKYQQMEMTYEVSLFVPYAFAVTRDYVIDYACEASGWFMPGSCTYVWND